MMDEDLDRLSSRISDCIGVANRRLERMGQDRALLRLLALLRTAAAELEQLEQLESPPAPF